MHPARSSLSTRARVNRRAPPRHSLPLAWLAPGPHKRSFCAVDGVLARVRDLWNRDQRFIAVFQGGADIERTGVRISSHHQKIVADFKASMSRAGGQDRDVGRLQDQRAPFGATKQSLAGATRNTQHFVNPKLVMRIVVRAVAPRGAPAITFEQVLEYGGGIEGFRQTDRALVDDERPFGMVGNKPIVLEPASLRRKSTWGSSGRLQPVAFSVMRLTSSRRLIAAIQMICGVLSNVSPGREVPFNRWSAKCLTGKDFGQERSTFRGSERIALLRRQRREMTKNGNSGGERAGIREDVRRDAPRPILRLDGALRAVADEVDRPMRAERGNAEMASRIRSNVQD